MKIILTLFTLSVLALAAIAGDNPTRPTAEDTGYTPREWTLVGPFANRTLTSPNASGATRGGYDDDLLAPIGGEVGARLDKKVTLPPGITATKVTISPGAFVDFQSAFPESDNKVAYAYGVIKSPRAQKLYISFGSDDAAKVWVNGKQVHALWTPGRAAEPENDRFEISVEKGDNPVLIKVENAAGGWGFYFRAFDREGWRRARLEQATRDLPNQEIGQAGGSGYLFSSPQFPVLDWKNGVLVEQLLAEEPLKVRWFDEAGNEVTEAKIPGMYLAHVEVKTRQGQLHKRLLSFVRVGDGRWFDFIYSLYSPEENFQLPAEPPRTFPFDSATWETNRPYINFLSAVGFSDLLTRTQEGAQALAWLAQTPPSSGSATITGANLNEVGLKAQGRMLAIKRKIGGVSGAPLKPPTKLAASEAAPILRKGTATEAKIRPEAVAELDALLAEWSREEGKPFSVVLARNGVVFLHAAYGEFGGKKLDKDATFYPASIGKAIAGILLAEFIDQGLLAPDDPLGKFLPDFPKSGSQAITFRHCFTHTSGLTGHGTFGGLQNPYLDNAFSLSLAALEPGTIFRYGGDGNNLAGKAMEVISGKPMVRLLQEYLFTPLGATSIRQPDLGFAESANALDIAKIGQLLLNQGAYGEYRFFSPETYRKMLPTRLAQYFPKMMDKNVEWGLGLSYMPDPDGPREKGELGPDVIGHGSASSSIFRVDSATGLVVVMGRYGVGKAEKYNEYRGKLMRLLKQSLVLP